LDKLSSIPPFKLTNSLTSKQDIAILKNLKGEKFGVSNLGVDVFLGYSLDSAPGEIYFNGKPISFFID
jgi:hypothetical protein